MIGRHHSGFGFAAGSALLLWSAFLILGLCCPIATPPSCHGDRSPGHCTSGMIERPALTDSVGPVSALPASFTSSHCAVRDGAVARANAGMSMVRRSVATFLLDEQFLI
jgi:hypothetical protein